MHQVQVVVVHVIALRAGMYGLLGALGSGLLWLVVPDSGGLMAGVAGLTVALLVGPHLDAAIDGLQRRRNGESEG